MKENQKKMKRRKEKNMWRKSLNTMKRHIIKKTQVSKAAP